MRTSTPPGPKTNTRGTLFRTTGRDRKLTATRMHRGDVLRMIYRRAKRAGLDVHVCCHMFRTTGITAYLENGGTIERGSADCATNRLVRQSFAIRRTTS